MGCRIVGIEYVFPDNCISNSDLQLEFPNYDFSKFEDKIGIKNRYVVSGSETALDLAIKSSLLLFDRFDKSIIDFVLYCTQSPEYILPTTACILQNKLNLSKNVGAFDFNLGCSGYTYGLSMAKALINSGQAKNVLVVTAETYSKYLNIGDKSNRAIFGDAATSTLVSYCEGDFLNEFQFGSDGSGYDNLIIKNGAGKFKHEVFPIEKIYGTDNKYTDNNLYMNGPEIFSFTNSVIPGFVNKLLDANSLNINEIDQFILHQANSFMLNSIRKKLKIEPHKFFIDLYDGGNTVSNTIPIALKRYSQSNNDLDQTIMLVGFGVGLSWSGGVIKINGKL
ncbi:ketoacyl-ACP synthase III [Aquirufa sp.]|jgi:3-oxoacyl-[acyl-carrier-protein] synthase-3|uniref:ketoacyl-ACP synthase III n=1 Tax=Aquirufa sp. TaxID=2676249 RepID=UPI0037843D74